MRQPHVSCGSSIKRNNMFKFLSRKKQLAPNSDFLFVGRSSDNYALQSTFKQVIQSLNFLNNKGLVELVVTSLSTNLPVMFLIGTFYSDERFVVQLSDEIVQEEYKKYVDEHVSYLTGGDDGSERYLYPEQLFLYVPILDKLFSNTSVRKCAVILNEDGSIKDTVYFKDNTARN